MEKFQDLLRRIDDALAAAGGDPSKAQQIVALATQRADLEKALAATEEAWLELAGEME